MEESTLRRNNREATRNKSYESGFSKGRLEIKDKPRFKKSFSNQVPSEFPKARDDKISNPKSQKGRCTYLPRKKGTCVCVAINISVTA